jgi:hypothetical protein
MYHGCVKVARMHYRDTYVPGVGTLSAPAGLVETLQHHYTCDHCGREFRFPEAASEPFYCHSPSWPKTNTRVTSRKLAHHALSMHRSRFLLCSQIAVDSTPTDL